MHVAVTMVFKEPYDGSPTYLKVKQRETTSKNNLKKKQLKTACNNFRQSQMEKYGRNFNTGENAEEEKKHRLVVFVFKT